MQTIKRRVRRDYAPLNLSVTLEWDKDSAPLSQVFNSTAEDGAQYEPDRGVTSTVIYPRVIATAKDDSWDDRNINDLLYEMQWCVASVDENGNAKDVDISSLSEWSGGYSINKDTSLQRGALTITRNISALNPVSLRFKAKFLDSRRGVVNTVTSDYIQLVTVDQSKDAVSISLGNSDWFRYDPLEDPLLEYEYLVSKGEVEENSELRAKYEADPNSYLFKMPVYFFSGGELVSADDYELSLNYSADAESTVGELVSITKESYDERRTYYVITIDCRFVEKRGYTITAQNDKAGKLYAQFCIGRVYPRISVEMMNTSPIRVGDTTRMDQLRVTYHGRVIAHPEVAYAFVWKTLAGDSTTPVSHGEGTRVSFDLAKAGVSDDASATLTTYVEYDTKATPKIATDENGDILTDGAGNEYIFT